MKWSGKHIVISFFLLALTSSLLSQSSPLPDINWRHLDYRNGLPEYAQAQEIVQDNLGRIWICYDRGLYVYNGSEIRGFPILSNDPRSLSEENIQALLKTKDGRIWIGTRNRGLSIYDPTTAKFEHILPKEEGGPLPINRVWRLHEDDEGIIWISAKPGLVRHDPDENTFEHYVFNPQGYTEVEKDFYNTGRKLLEDPLNNNRMFYGSRGGLLSFDKITREFTHHMMPWDSREEQDMGAPNYLVVDFIFEDSVNLWAVTWAGGIINYNIITGEWKRYFDKSATGKKTVGYEIRSRDANSFWIVTTYGLGIFNKNDFTYHYYKQDNSDPNAFRQHRIVFALKFTPDSCLIAAATLGVEIANPFPTVKPITPAFQPYISRLITDGRKMQLDSNVAYTEHFQLSDDIQQMRVQITLPYFQHLDDIQYQYKMEGIDQSWVDNGNQREINYAGLKGGKYKLHFRARVGEGEWKMGLTTPTIDVHFPFWKHWLFIPSIAIVFLGLVYSLYRIRLEGIRKEQHLKTEFNTKLAEVEMAALRAQMNPHFMFNSLNSIKTYILKEKTHEASAYLTKFSQLMRAVLRNSKSELVPLEEEVKALELYIELEALRFEDEFTYQINISDSLDTQALYLPPLLIQPYVENAIRHGLLEKLQGERNLTIQILPHDEKQICIVIEDNGIGRTKANQRKKLSNDHKKSFGMEITQNRIDLIQEKLNIQADVEIEDLVHTDGSGAGTRVVITIPKIYQNGTS